MAIDGEEHGAKTEGSDAVSRKEGAEATTPRGASRTGLVLGSLAGLLILAGAIYYFADYRGGTEIATDSSSERPAGPAVPDIPRASDNAQKPASPTTTSQAPPSTQPQSPQPSEPQQSASAPPPPPATALAETPAAPPATTASPPVTPATPPAMAASPPATIAQDSAKSQVTENERSPDAATAAPSANPGATTQANPTAQPSMRDQPAALPDQPAATPKKESVLVVMRGPANIRSAPGKNRARDRDGAQRRHGQGARPLRKLGAGRNRRGHGLDQRDAAGHALAREQVIGLIARSSPIRSSRSEIGWGTRIRT